MTPPQRARSAAAVGCNPLLTCSPVTATAPGDARRCASSCAGGNRRWPPRPAARGAAATWTSGNTQDYRFTVTVKDGVLNGNTTSNDTGLFDFVWEARSA